RSWRRSRDYLCHVITVKLKMYKFLPGSRSQPQNPLPGLPDLLGPDGLRLPAHAGPSGTARFPGEPVFQNPSLRPSCRMRGSRAERTLLKFRLAIEKDAQQTGLKWLKVLKVSKRNWPVKRSVNFRFLNKARSVRQKPGRRTAPGFSEGMVDRKSTRLNSSHQISSYAVFCLKTTNK